MTGDPVGLWAGINIFTFVQNNPLLWSDPEGLASTITPINPQDGCPPNSICIDPGSVSPPIAPWERPFFDPFTPRGIPTPGLRPLPNIKLPAPSKKMLPYYPPVQKPDKEKDKEKDKDQKPVYIEQMENICP